MDFGGFFGGGVLQLEVTADISNQNGMIYSNLLLEKEMATHSSILAWRIPWMEEPGGLQSTGSQSRSDTTEQATELYRIK